MTSAVARYERGAEWRQWDLHIHTPASFHWDGQKFKGDPTAAENVKLIDGMIDAFNEARPAVFAIMDYWTFDGWFALKERLKQGDAPKLTKTVFPGIELRLSAPKCRLNAHVIFSDEADDQVLKDFLSGLTVEIVNRPLSKGALIELARKVDEDKLQQHGFAKKDVDEDLEKALLAGAKVAEINCDSYKRAIGLVPQGLAVGFMPFDTSDGLAEVDWIDHYAYFIGLFRSSPIFESRNLDLRDCFLNIETDKNKGFLKNFQAALGNTPRLVVSGSDAHRFKGQAGNNDKRGYGDYPSGKATWIKADPTFRGLVQAIKEPEKRSFIGRTPPKVAEVEAHKTYFIDRVRVSKIASAPSAGTWLAGVDVPLNQDLIAVIGNKGSGKSALADVIALLGHSKQKQHFSFLKKDRFRGKSGDPAKYFEASLQWLDGSVEAENLNDDPAADKVELVRYIPQGHFESLCNDHVSGRSAGFEHELREVIFSHLDDTVRLGALNFDQLIEKQEAGFRDQLNELRKDIRKTNDALALVEEEMQPAVRGAAEELLGLKNKQVEEFLKIKPEDRDPPPDTQTPEQAAASKKLGEIAALEAQAIERSQNAALELSAVSAKMKAVQNIRERLQLLERAYKSFVTETATDCDRLGVSADSIATIKITLEPLDAAQDATKGRQLELVEITQQAASAREALIVERAALKGKLDAPQLEYQKYLAELRTWNESLEALIGLEDSPESQKGLERRIKQLDDLPSKRAGLVDRRQKLSGEIFDVLNQRRMARASLFKPVQDLIQENALIREEYKLQFQATLGASPEQVATMLFALIKQNSGEFRGEDESYAVIRKLADKYDLNNRTDVLAFVSELRDKIELAASNTGGVGIRNALRKDRSVAEVYDLLFGLGFLEPRYSLQFQETQIEQLSPGQRGALLLIFYLLVDQGRNPILLDQPEENLDNETVVGLLVPVLTEAKKRRQIIMVTHNPNLAVVCDAEQVIHASFDRKNDFKISYLAGSIENPQINNFVVDVLEGTMPAFSNRGSKYQ